MESTAFKYMTSNVKLKYFPEASSPRVFGWSRPSLQAAGPRNAILDLHSLKCQHPLYRVTTLQGYKNGWVQTLDSAPISLVLSFTLWITLEKY